MLKKYAISVPHVMSSACAKFTKPVVPKMSDRPIAAIARYKPSLIPSSVN
jgi:hypothetical protein